MKCISRKALVLLLTVLIAMLPVAVFANWGNDEPCWLGKKQVDKELGILLWMGFGLVTGPIAVFVALNDNPPNPNMSIVAGKSSDYIDRYVECYKNVKYDDNVAGAIAGCTVMSLSIMTFVFLGDILF